LRGGNNKQIERRESEREIFLGAKDTHTLTHWLEKERTRERTRR